MINDTLFSIVAYRPNKDRIISLLDNDELSSVDFSLFFAEDQRYQSRYTYTIASRTNWYESVDKIRPGLLRNLKFPPGLQLTNLCNILGWNRELKRGDLSFPAYVLFSDFLNLISVSLYSRMTSYYSVGFYLDFIFKMSTDYLDLVWRWIITNSPTCQ